ncbi:MAG: AbrB/MazE/SpoVT family DNA-binding domain-containing protein [bacterium]
MIKRKQITRKLTQSGCKSWYVTLPPKVIERFGWMKGDDIEILVDREKGEIVLKK